MPKETTIFKLNNYCLSCILKYLDYKDHASFVHVCQHFRQAFQEIVPQQYKKIRLEQPNIQYKLVLFFTLSNSVELLYIDLDYLVNLTARLHLYDKWYQKLWQPPSLVEQIFLALKTSSNLKTLQLYSKDYFKTWSFKHISKLTQLKELHISLAYMSAKNWLQLCKKNSDLRVLQSACQDNRALLKHLSKQCKNLQQLGICLNAYDANFKKIVELPKLSRLKIHGFRHTKELTQLFELFANSTSPQLETLQISGNYVGLETVQHISNIESLRILNLEIADSKCIKPLSALTELKTISIYMWIMSDLDAFFPVIKSCTKLKMLKIARGIMKSSFITEVIEILKMIRNADEQAPLEMKLYACEREPQIAAARASKDDEKYMRIEYYSENSFKF